MGASNSSILAEGASLLFSPFHHKLSDCEVRGTRCNAGSAGGIENSLGAFRRIWYELYDSIRSPDLDGHGRPCREVQIEMS
jgi:hypothetical protein